MIVLEMFDCNCKNNHIKKKNCALDPAIEKHVILYSRFGWRNVAFGRRENAAVQGFLSFTRTQFCTKKI